MLWVLDNSCSMSDKIQAVEQGLDSFIDSFVDMGLDYRIGVITTDMDDPAQSGQLQGTPSVLDSSTMTRQQIIDCFDSAYDANSPGSGDERPMEASYAALDTPGYAISDGLVRTDAHLSIILMTDEEDGSSNNASYWTTWAEGLKSDPGMVNVSGLIPQAGDIWDTSGGCSDPISATKLESIIDNSGGFATASATWSTPAAPPTRPPSTRSCSGCRTAPPACSRPTS